MLRLACERADLRRHFPAFKVAYGGEPLTSAAVMQLVKPAICILTSPELAAFIDRLHDCDFCRRNAGGRYSRAQARQ